MHEQIYTITIYRVDRQDMKILESDDIKEIEKVYNELVDEWVTSTAEKRPFKHLFELHSFLPSLISEIKVESISKEEYHRQNNPHYKQMQREGFSGVMNRNFNNGGY